MVSFFNKVYNFRANDFDEDEVVKLKIGNLSAFLAITISTFYSFLYLFYIDSIFATIVNQTFAFLYFIYFQLIKKDELLKARLAFFTIFLIHMLIIVMFFASSASGFHFYYILSVPGAFLFFSKEDKQIKYGIPIVAFIFFVLCHLSGSAFSSFEFSKTLFDFIFLATIASVFIILAIVMAAFHDELKKKEKKLEELSTTDSLTGIYNRRAFYTFADRMIKYSRRYNDSLGLIIFDIDFFKIINDVHGHDIGDLVLKEISKVVSSSLRETDRLARFGGEEFIILLPEVSQKSVESIAEKLRVLIENTKIQDIDVSASFGISLLKDEDNIESLIKRADIALYEAKKSGRNKVCSLY